MTDFDMDNARLVARGYKGSPHKVYEDLNGRRLLLCETQRVPGVSINWPALKHFRESGGEFVGVKNPDFKAVVPLSKIAGIEPYGSNDYIVIRPGDVGVEVAARYEPIPF